MIIHVPSRNFIARVQWRNILRWRRLAAAARTHWDHGYITVGPFEIERW